MERERETETERQRQRQRDRETETERVTQQGIIDVGFSDIQFIFCTIKISRIKRGSHKHIKFHSFKHYSADLFKETQLV